MDDYVEPYTKGVDAIKPPKVETAGPYVESVDSKVETQEPVLPVFDVDAEPEKESAPTQTESKSESKSGKSGR